VSRTATTSLGIQMHLAGVRGGHLNRQILLRMPAFVKNRFEQTHGSHKDTIGKPAHQQYFCESRDTPLQVYGQ
jgi:hypothetical protein